MPQKVPGGLDPSRFGTLQLAEQLGASGLVKPSWPPDSPERKGFNGIKCWELWAGSSCETAVWRTILQAPPRREHSQHPSECIPLRLEEGPETANLSRGRRPVLSFTGSSPIST